MTGYHEVKVFSFKDDHGVLPDGWKPFSASWDYGRLFVVARKWHPTGKK